MAEANIIGRARGLGEGMREWLRTAGLPPAEADDAAEAAWGEDWRMMRDEDGATADDFDALHAAWHAGLGTSDAVRGAGR